MKPCHWLELVLCVPFSAITMIVVWQADPKTSFHEFPSGTHAGGIADQIHQEKLLLNRSSSNHSQNVQTSSMVHQRRKCSSPPRDASVRLS